MSFIGQPPPTGSGGLSSVPDPLTLENGLVVSGPADTSGISITNGSLFVGGESQLIDLTCSKFNFSAAPGEIFRVGAGNPVAIEDALTVGRSFQNSSLSVHGSTYITGRLSVGGPTALIGAVTLPLSTELNNVNLKTTIDSKANLTLLTSNKIAIGANAGETQGDFGIAIGTSAGQVSQGFNSVAIGRSAGVSSQGSGSVAIGAFAGTIGQASNSIILNASGAALNNTAEGALVVKPVRPTAVNTHLLTYNDETGEISKSTPAQVETSLTGKANLSLFTVSRVKIGTNAGETVQGNRAIAIGESAGNSTQGENGVAVGFGAGQSTQGASAVAVGVLAGQTSQGASSIAIGGQAGRSSQAPNSIILNATGAVLNNAVGNSFVVKPIRETEVNSHILSYNDTTGEIGKSTVEQTISSIVSMPVALYAITPANYALPTTSTLLSFSLATSTGGTRKITYNSGNKSFENNSGTTVACMVSFNARIYMPGGVASEVVFRRSSVGLAVHNHALTAGASEGTLSFTMLAILTNGQNLTLEMRCTGTGANVVSSQLTIMELR
jgi:hypothetical protein